jgi:DNA repair exonuclease SbcCD nuclease subunit
MKVAIASDIHFHSFKPFSTLQNGVNSRFAEIVQSFTWMVNDAKNSGCEVLLIPGDLFHTRGQMKPSVFNMVVRLIQDTADKMVVVILPGNHDMENYKGGETAVDTLEALKDVYVFRKAGTLCIRGITILGVPYVHDHKEFLNGLAKYKDTDFDCMMIHQGVDNFASAGMPELGVTVDSLKAFTEKPIFAGHYHLPRKVDNVLSPGSLVQHGFGDPDEAKGYWIWDVDSGEITMTEVPGPVFKTISTKKQAQSVPTGCYVRVEAGTAGQADKLMAVASEAGAVGTVARINKKFKAAHEKTLKLEGPKEMFVAYLLMMEETKDDASELMQLFEEIVEAAE